MSVDKQPWDMAQFRGYKRKLSQRDLDISKSFEHNEFNAWVLKRIEEMPSGQSTLDYSVACNKHALLHSTVQPVKVNLLGPFHHREFLLCTEAYRSTYSAQDNVVMTALLGSLGPIVAKVCFQAEEQGQRLQLTGFIFSLADATDDGHLVHYVNQLGVPMVRRMLPTEFVLQRMSAEDQQQGEHMRGLLEDMIAQLKRKPKKRRKHTVCDVAQQAAIAATEAGQEEAQPAAPAAPSPLLDGKNSNEIFDFATNASEDYDAEMLDDDLFFSEQLLTDMGEGEQTEEEGGAQDTADPVLNGLMDVSMVSIADEDAEDQPPDDAEHSDGHGVSSSDPVHIERREVSEDQVDEVSGIPVIPNPATGLPTAVTTTEDSDQERFDAFPSVLRTVGTSADEEDIANGQHGLSGLSDGTAPSTVAELGEAMMGSHSVEVAAHIGAELTAADSIEEIESSLVVMEEELPTAHEREEPDSTIGMQTTRETIDDSDELFMEDRSSMAMDSTNSGSPALGGHHVAGCVSVVDDDCLEMIDSDQSAEEQALGALNGFSEEAVGTIESGINHIESQLPFDDASAEAQAESISVAVREEGDNVVQTGSINTSNVLSSVEPFPAKCAAMNLVDDGNNHAPQAFDGTAVHEEDGRAAVDGLDKISSPMEVDSLAPYIAAGDIAMDDEDILSLGAARFADGLTTAHSIEEIEPSVEEELAAAHAREEPDDSIGMPTTQETIDDSDKLFTEERLSMATDSTDCGCPAPDGHRVDSDLRIEEQPMGELSDCSEEVAGTSERGSSESQLPLNDSSTEAQAERVVVAVREEDDSAVQTNSINDGSFPVQYIAMVLADDVAVGDDLAPQAHDDVADCEEKDTSTADGLDKIGSPHHTDAGTDTMISVEVDSLATGIDVDKTNVEDSTMDEGGQAMSARLSAAAEAALEDGELEELSSMDGEQEDNHSDGLPQKRKRSVDEYDQQLDKDDRELISDESLMNERSAMAFARTGDEQIVDGAAAVLNDDIEIFEQFGQSSEQFGTLFRRNEEDIVALQHDEASARVGDAGEPLQIGEAAGERIETAVHEEEVGTEQTHGVNANAVMSAAETFLPTENHDDNCMELDNDQNGHISTADLCGQSNDLIDSIVVDEEEDAVEEGLERICSPLAVPDVPAPAAESGRVPTVANDRIIVDEFARIDEDGHSVSAGFAAQSADTQLLEQGHHAETDVQDSASISEEVVADPSSCPMELCEEDEEEELLPSPTANHSNTDSCGVPEALEMESVDQRTGGVEDQQLGRVQDRHVEESAPQSLEQEDELLLLAREAEEHADGSHQSFPTVVLQDDHDHSEVFTADEAEDDVADALDSSSLPSDPATPVPFEGSGEIGMKEEEPAATGDRSSSPDDGPSADGLADDEADSEDDNVEMAHFHIEPEPQEAKRLSADSLKADGAFEEYYMSDEEDGARVSPRRVQATAKSPFDTTIIRTVDDLCCQNDPSGMDSPVPVRLEVDAVEATLVGDLEEEPAASTDFADSLR